MFLWRRPSLSYPPSSAGVFDITMRPVNLGTKTAEGQVILSTPKI